MTTAPTVLDRIAPFLPRLAWANLIANIGIVVTGGAVRLTGSGLGCPTWPRCTEDSYVAHGALGINGAIEFGNRMLTFVLVVVAIACWLAALGSARAARRTSGSDAGRRPLLLATVIALGIPAQAILGGITVLTDLNPWVVAGHFAVSMVIVGCCVWLVDVVVPTPRPAASRPLRRLAWVVLASCAVTVYLGTVVTGAGPHSGDLDSRRNGLDPQLVTHVHAISVYLLLALSFALAVAARRAGATHLASTAVVLLGVELAQGVVGWVQYFTDLPIVLVALHMLGAALVVAGAARATLAAHSRALAA